MGVAKEQALAKKYKGEPGDAGNQRGKGTWSTEVKGWINVTATEVMKAAFHVAWVSGECFVMVDALIEAGFRLSAKWDEKTDTPMVTVNFPADHELHGFLYSERSGTISRAIGRAGFLLTTEVLPNAAHYARPVQRAGDDW